MIEKMKKRFDERMVERMGSMWSDLSEPVKEGLFECFGGETFEITSAGVTAEWLNSAGQMVTVEDGIITDVG